MYAVEVEHDSELLFELLKEYTRSSIIGFKKYLESISSRVECLPNKGGYALFFERECERTLFYLKRSS